MSRFTRQNKSADEEDDGEFDFSPVKDTKGTSTTPQKSDPTKTMIPDSPVDKQTPNHPAVQISPSPSPSIETSSLSAKDKLANLFGRRPYTNHNQDGKKASDSSIPEFDAIQWKEAIAQGKGEDLLRIILEEVGKLPEGSRGIDKKYEFTTNIVKKMNSILTHEFLHVNLHHPPRDVELNDWSGLKACQKSEGGSIGIYFLECQRENIVDRRLVSEVVVAKKCDHEDYQIVALVYLLAKYVFGIPSPKPRYLTKHSREYNELKDAAKALFGKVWDDLYEIGGTSSPKQLFESEGILLLEFMKGGSSMKDKKAGQRELTADDYKSLGKLFVLDLIIRNTDRLPCRKAIPRPTRGSFEAQGNAGNVMFGQEPGVVISIDPDMKLPTVGPETEKYLSAVSSVTQEVLLREDKEDWYKSIAAFFFRRITGLSDVLPTSLDETNFWLGNPHLKTPPIGDEERVEAIKSILAIVRAKAKHYEKTKVAAELAALGQYEEYGYAQSHRSTRHHTQLAIGGLPSQLSFRGVYTPMLHSVPSLQRDEVDYSIARPKRHQQCIQSIPPKDVEQEWREWMRLHLPRAVEDILEFVEYYTGYKRVNAAADAFVEGFKEGILHASNFAGRYELRQEELQHESHGQKGLTEEDEEEMFFRQLDQLTSSSGNKGGQNIASKALEFVLKVIKSMDMVQSNENKFRSVRATSTNLMRSRANI